VSGYSVVAAGRHQKAHTTVGLCKCQLYCSQRFFFLRRPSFCATAIVTRPAPIRATVPGSGTLTALFEVFLLVDFLLDDFLLDDFLLDDFLLDDFLLDDFLLDKFLPDESLEDDFLVITSARVAGGPRPTSAVASKAPSILTLFLIIATFPP